MPLQYLLLAEFDITVGSIIRECWPAVALPDDVHATPRKGGAKRVLTPSTESFFAERMLPEGIHGRLADETLFYCERALLPAHIPSPSAAAAEDEDADLLLCVNCVRTQLDASIRRGARVLALCGVFSYPAAAADACTPLLHDAINRAFSLPVEDLSPFLRGLFESLSVWASTCEEAMTTRTRRAVLRGLLPLQGKSLTLGSSQPHTHAFTHVSVPVGRCKVDLTLPRFIEPFTAHSCSVTALVHRVGPGILTLLTAILACKRVLFIATSKDVPARDVSFLVAACAHMVSPPFPSTAIAARMFPYATLNDLSFLSVEGYIAGVTNPLFEAKEEWWDVAVRVGPRTHGGAPVTLSMRVPHTRVVMTEVEGQSAAPVEVDEPVQPPASAAGGTVAQMQSECCAVRVREGAMDFPVTEGDAAAQQASSRAHDAALYRRMRSGAKFGEHWLRAQCEAYTSMVLRTCGLLSTTRTPRVHPSVRSFMESHGPRLQAIARTGAYAAYEAHVNRVRGQLEGVAGEVLDVVTLLRTPSSLAGDPAPPLQQMMHPWSAIQARAGEDGATRGEQVNLDSYDALQVPAREDDEPAPRADAAATLPLPVLRSLHAAFTSHPAAVETLVAAMPEYGGGLHPLASGLMHTDVRVRALTVQLLQCVEACEWAPAAAAVRSLNFVLQAAYGRHKPLVDAAAAGR